MAPPAYVFSRRAVGDKPHWIAPFGNPRIKVCLPLPEAYRSLPRPSSPDGAKASVVRPYTLSRRASSRRIETLPLGLRCISQKTFNCQRSVYRSWTHLAELVGVPGIGPGTSSLSGTRSNQLSYTPSSAWSGRDATDSLCGFTLPLCFHRAAP